MTEGRKKGKGDEKKATRVLLISKVSDSISEVFRDATTGGQERRGGK